MADFITLTINGRSTSVAPGTTVAAAIAIAAAAPSAARLPGGEAAAGITRRSVGGKLRAPLCGMGVCQECRVTINGRAHVLSCQTLCLPGMDVQTGAAA
ncbi:(2Fe-2S)-binding protein [Pseudoduganella eburnea]|uniref:(2Fe-2S)-binding protein n=1 Tax=Massilia eburnea TaxID=1776165 RepID=A0A6L6QMJ4_9BURK|nr:2Fe-2S iron-sulfur cluster-binding protein [Massilia eburnea]MTW13385.1 (2Fe-2S)-binding protein [Massilia eburnea]